MGENTRYGKRPRFCENDGEAWTTSSDSSDDDPSIPVDGSRSFNFLHHGGDMNGAHRIPTGVGTNFDWRTKLSRQVSLADVGGSGVLNKKGSLRMPLRPKTKTPRRALPPTRHPSFVNFARQTNYSYRDSENIYEDEETAELFQIAFSLSIYGDPDETSNETIGFQKYATFNTIADEAVPSTTPQDVTNIEIPEHATASQEQDTAACTSADSSPFTCELCKVDLVTFDLFCEHLSVHKEEDPTGQERTVALEPIPLLQQCQGEGTVDASMTYNETIGFQHSILNTIADEAVPSTSPQTVNNIE
ncbi:hypothetical protein HPB50_011997 [Hyalomma asiaticum]|uniref:Uncharacterized protein n=1 Tax=Hyalomma asiaticum TaxID=266040 RepID=A0ACB7T258_HYAAI|nr:hypothetical protein HPB50_011997 [Hyalomma asiaticum]